MSVSVFSARKFPNLLVTLGILFFFYQNSYASRQCEGELNDLRPMTSGCDPIAGTCQFSPDGFESWKKNPQAAQGRIRASANRYANCVGANQEGEPPLQFFTSMTLSVPCEADSGNATRGCMLGLRYCGAKDKYYKGGVIQEIKDDLDRSFKTKIEYLYKGIDVSFLETKDKADPKGNPFPGPICNPAQGEGVDGRDSNHVGQGCGDWAHLTPDGACVGTGCRNSPPRPWGQRENSYRKGAWVQSLIAFKEQVKNEISQGKLRVSLGCTALAQDVQAGYKNNTEYSDKIVSAVKADTGGVEGKLKNICSQEEAQQSKNFEQAEKKSVIELCALTNSESDAWNMAGKDAVKHRQSACYLAASRTATEGAFKQLAMCEIGNRAKLAYRQTFQSRGKRKSPYMNQYMKQVAEPCESVVTGCVMDNCVSMTGVDMGCAKERCYVQEGGKCYRSKYPQFIERFVKKRFPAQGAQS